MSVINSAPHLACFLQNAKRVIFVAKCCAQLRLPGAQRDKAESEISDLAWKLLHGGKQSATPLSLRANSPLSLLSPVQTRVNNPARSRRLRGPAGRKPALRPVKIRSALRRTSWPGLVGQLSVISVISCSNLSQQFRTIPHGWHRADQNQPPENSPKFESAFANKPIYEQFAWVCL